MELRASHGDDYLEQLSFRITQVNLFRRINKLEPLDYSDTSSAKKIGVLPYFMETSNETQNKLNSLYHFEFVFYLYKGGYVGMVVEHKGS